MTAPIVGFAIDEFRNGRRLVYAAEAGAFDAISKEGAVTIPFKAGDLILAGPDGRAICGPVGITGALDLAERILDGDARALTDPLSLLVLATAVAGFLAPQADADPLRSARREAV